MGARTWQYWRYVGGPVLFPSFLGCVLLLFGSALSAYATAEAMTSGTIPLTAIQIGSFLNGNVLAGQQNVGKALGLGLVIIIAIAMALYTLLQRRAARWLQ
jgi:putative spermidine/putrescine transport system permease protein